MTEKAEKRSESFLADQGHSLTASTIGNVLFGPSGAISYRITVASAAGMAQVDIVAVSGDEAADQALKRFMGGKVIHVDVTPQEALAA